MKKLIALLIAFICLFGIAIGESPATPTDLDALTNEDDLEYFEDDEWGYVDSEMIERQVFVEAMREPTYYGEEITLIAILMNFRPDDVYYIEWEESADEIEWELIPNANSKIYKFILTRENATHSWRAKVTIED